MVATAALVAPVFPNLRIFSVNDNFKNTLEFCKVFALNLFIGAARSWYLRMFDGVLP